MGRSGYETTNFGDAESPRPAGVGVISPPSPKGKGKERACDAPSGLCSAAGTAQTPHECLPPVKRSSDFREAVIEPFPELPPSLYGRRRSAFGLDVGPRGYAAAPASGSGTRTGAAGLGARTPTGRPRASGLSETQTGSSSSDPIDVEMGGTDVSSPPSPTGSVRTVIGNNDDDMDDDGLKTPRASHSALPEYQPSQLAQRLHQQHGYGNAYKYRAQPTPTPKPDGNMYQYPSQFISTPKPPPPLPGKILRSQASQFPDGYTPNTNNNNGSRAGNGADDNSIRNFHIWTQGLRPGSSRPTKFRPGTLSSGGTFTGGYDFGFSMSGSSGSSSSSSSQSFGMSTTPRQTQAPMGFRPGYRGLMTGEVTPRASELGPPPGFGYSNTGGSYARSHAEITGRGAGACADADAVDNWDSYFALPPELTQAEKDRRRKAALDAGFEELKRKKQRTQK